MPVDSERNEHLEPAPDRRPFASHAQGSAERRQDDDGRTPSGLN